MFWNMLSIVHVVVLDRNVWLEISIVLQTDFSM